MKFILSDSLEDFKTRKIPTPIEGLNCDKVNDYFKNLNVKI